MCIFLLFSTERKEEEKEENKKRAPVLNPHRMSAKHTERVNYMRLGRVIVNTVTCYSRGLATGLNAVILTHFCARFRLRKWECDESFESEISRGARFQSFSIESVPMPESFGASLK